MIILSVSGGPGTRKLLPMMFVPVEPILYARTRHECVCVLGGGGGGREEGVPRRTALKV